MSNIAVNDAGEVMLFRDGAWTAAPMAQNERGMRMFFDGAAWQSAPGSQAQQPARASRWDRFTTGLGDMAHGGAQLLANTLPTGVVEGVNDAAAWVNRQPVVGPVTRALGMTPATPQEINQRVTEREREYQASRGPDPGIDWARIGGQVVAGLPIAAATTPATLPGAVGVGALTGAAQGALQPVTEGEYAPGAIQNAAFGALAGGAGGAAAYGLGRVLQGRQAASVRPEVRELSDAGVRLTPGQIAGGYAQRVEDSLGSVPVLGAQIRARQAEGIESFNRAVANRVLAPLGQRVNDNAPVGRELVENVYERIGAAYDDVLPRVRPFGADAQFGQELAQATQQAVTPSSQGAFASIMQNDVLPRVQGAAIDGRTWKEIDQRLGFHVRSYLRSNSPADQETARALLETQGAFRRLLGRANPNIAPEVRAADQAFAQYIRMERAAAGQAATDGVFSPAQFSGAVRMSDPTARRGAYARGDALMQDLSDAGRAVMPRTVPDSGTPERAALIALLAGGPAMATGASPASIAAGLAAAGVYSNPGRAMVQAALLGRRPEALAAAGRGLVPLGAPGAASYFLAPPSPGQPN